MRPPRRQVRARRGFSALEVLVASALLAAAFVPLVAALGSSSRVAHLDDRQLLASRRVRRVLADLRARPYHRVVAQAVGEAPPAGLDPRLSPSARALPVDLPPPAEDVRILGPDPGELEGYRRRIEGMPVGAYLEELEPGLARVTAVVTWEDPIRRTPRHRVAVTYLEDPFHWRREP